MLSHTNGTLLPKIVKVVKTKDLESNKLKGILSSLYNEALSLDTI